MSCYVGKREDEVFIGNVPVQEGVPGHLSQLKTARLGEKALDIDGNNLPGHQPLFIHRSESDAYHRIMMNKTFPGTRF